MLSAPPRPGPVNPNVPPTVLYAHIEHIAFLHVSGQVAERPHLDSAIGKLNAGVLTVEAVYDHAPKRVVRRGRARIVGHASP
ncbi:hypothetical protein GCM10008019_39880 [Deinococcus soli (ex Cha et al. 2016)]|nr:hypothetical protein GCM10008019_39880 [Deinococcus soli (ex Cha et al. 2016)]